MILKKLKQIRCRLLLIGKHKIAFRKTSTFGRGTVFYAPNSMTIGENVGLIGKYDHDYSCLVQSINDSLWIGDADYQSK